MYWVETPRKGQSKDKGSRHVGTALGKETQLLHSLGTRRWHTHQTQAQFLRQGAKLDHTYAQDTNLNSH